MNWFYDLRIGTKLVAGFAVVALIAAAIGIIAISNLHSIQTADDNLYRCETSGVVQLDRISSAFHRARLNLLSLVIAKTPEEQRRCESRIQELVEAMNTAAGAYEKTLESQADRDLYSKYAESYRNYVPLREKVVALALAGKAQEATGIMHGEGQQAADQLKNVIDEMVAERTDKAKETAENNQHLASASVTSMLVILGLGVTLAIGLGLFIARGISRPVQRLAAQAETVATGDLTIEVIQESADEIGHLAASFGIMVENLRETIRRVGEASSAVASASSEISSSTEQMAAGAQEQTSQASEVASAVEEMTKTIVENSRNAGQTSETAKRAKQSAEEGGKIVEATVVGMKRIAEVVNRSAQTVRALGKSSDQIGEIIRVIDDIADQTNLLALNAAIEAARAGEQGRGFAVVADEVRKLAERTTKATKEIAGMIKTIQDDTNGAVASMEEGTGEVDGGIKLADRAGASLEEIVTMIQTLTDMVAHIAVASEQQSSASEQISNNVTAISSVTHETASGVQQIARAAEDLNRLTDSMQHLLDRFKVSGETDGDRNAAAASRQRKSRLAVQENGRLVAHDDHGSSFDIEGAKQAHFIWRTRIQKLVTGKENVDNNQVISHKDCQLGKWYYGRGQSEFGSDGVFMELGRKHEEMHDMLKKTVTAWNAGRTDEAKVNADHIYTLSNQVVELLDQLSRVPVR